jgi:hypothetical protein
MNVPYLHKFNVPTNTMSIPVLKGQIWGKYLFTYQLYKVYYVVSKYNEELLMY